MAPTCNPDKTTKAIDGNKDLSFLFMVVMIVVSETEHVMQTYKTKFEKKERRILGQNTSFLLIRSGWTPLNFRLELSLFASVCCKLELPPDYSWQTYLC